MRGKALKAAVFAAVSALVLSLAPTAQAAGTVDEAGPELLSATRTTGDVISAEAPDARVAVQATDPSGVRWIGVWIATDSTAAPGEWEFSSGIEPASTTRSEVPVWSYPEDDRANPQPQTLTVTRIEMLDTLNNRSVVTDRAILDPLGYRVDNPMYDGDAPVVESIDVEPDVVRPGGEVVVTAVVRDDSAVHYGSLTLWGDQFLRTPLDTVESEVVRGEGTSTIRTVFRARQDTPYASYPVKIHAYDRFSNALKGAAGVSIVVDDPEYAAGTVRIDGDRQVGQSLSAVAVDWDPAVSLSYSWRSRGSDVASVASVPLGAPMLWDDLLLVVTGTWPDGTVRSREKWSGAIHQGVLAISPPEIGSTGAVGSPMTFHQEVPDMAWAPGDRLVYWLRDGKPIEYASAASYAPTAADLGHRISVRTIHRPRGYVELVQESAPVVVGHGTLTAPNPTVGGSVWRVGRVLTVSTGVWTTGTQRSYQWQRDGKNIAGARYRSYTPTAADRGARLGVRVTGTNPGYTSVSRFSNVKTVGVGLLASTAPKVNGTSRVGGRLTAVAAGWTDGTSFRYQWQRDGRNIPGATGSTYVPGAADLGKKVRVHMVGSKAGYTSVARTSAPRWVGYGVLKSSIPTFSGTPKVGSRVTVSPGTWTPGTTLTYQWTRDGAKIGGATGRVYTVRAADRGRALSVWVTGSKPGYSRVGYEAFVRVR